MIRTKPFGESLREPWQCVPEEEFETHCKFCGKPFRSNAPYWEVGEDTYCEYCEEEAKQALADANVRRVDWI